MTSNEERFVKADVEACELEKRLGRELTSKEYSEFVFWHLKYGNTNHELRPPNPVE